MDVKPYLERIRKEFPSLRFKKWRVPHQGMDHVAIILDDRWVFRFPKTTEYKKLFKTEMELLGYLQKHITLPIPHYSHIAKDRSFGGYKLLPGRSMTCTAFKKLPKATKEKVTTQLARFLSELHALPLSIAQKYRVPKLDKKKELAASRREYRETLQKRLTKSEKNACERHFASWEMHLNDSFMPVLTHHDFYFMHILLSPAKREISGIIDFSDRAVDDPAIDFGELGHYGPRFVRSVYDQYTGPKDQHFLERAQLHFERVVMNALRHAAKGEFDTWEKMYPYFKQVICGR